MRLQYASCFAIAERVHTFHPTRQQEEKKVKSNLHSLNFALKQYKKNEFPTMYLILKTPLTKIMKVISHLG